MVTISTYMTRDIVCDDDVSITIHVNENTTAEDIIQELFQIRQTSVPALHFELTDYVLSMHSGESRYLLSSDCNVYSLLKVENRKHQSNSRLTAVGFRAKVAVVSQTEDERNYLVNSGLIDLCSFLISERQSPFTTPDTKDADIDISSNNDRNINNHSDNNSNNYCCNNDNNSYSDNDNDNDGYINGDSSSSYTANDHDVQFKSSNERDHHSLTNIHNTNDNDNSNSSNDNSDERKSGSNSSSDKVNNHEISTQTDCREVVDESVVNCIFGSNDSNDNDIANDSNLLSVDGTEKASISIQKRAGYSSSSYVLDYRQKLLDDRKTAENDRLVAINGKNTSNNNIESALSTNSSGRRRSASNEIIDSYGSSSGSSNRRSSSSSNHSESTDVSTSSSKEEHEEDKEEIKENETASGTISPEVVSSSEIGAADSISGTTRLSNASDNEGDCSPSQIGTERVSRDINNDFKIGVIDIGRSNGGAKIAIRASDQDLSCSTPSDLLSDTRARSGMVNNSGGVFNTNTPSDSLSITRTRSGIVREINGGSNTPSNTTSNTPSITCTRSRIVRDMNSSTPVNSISSNTPYNAPSSSRNRSGTARDVNDVSITPSNTRSKSAQNSNADLKIYDRKEYDIKENNSFNSPTNTNTRSANKGSKNGSSAPSRTLSHTPPKSRIRGASKGSRSSPNLNPNPSIPSPSDSSFLSYTRARAAQEKESNSTSLRKSRNSRRREAKKRERNDDFNGRGKRVDYSSNNNVRGPGGRFGSPKAIINPNLNLSDGLVSNNDLRGSSDDSGIQSQSGFSEVVDGGSGVVSETSEGEVLSGNEEVEVDTVSGSNEVAFGSSEVGSKSTEVVAESTEGVPSSSEAEAVSEGGEKLILTTVTDHIADTITDTISDEIGTGSTRSNSGSSSSNSSSSSSDRVNRNKSVNSTAHDFINKKYSTNPVGANFVSANPVSTIASSLRKRDNSDLETNCDQNPKPTSNFDLNINRNPNPTASIPLDTDITNRRNKTNASTDVSIGRTLNLLKRKPRNLESNDTTVSVVVDKNATPTILTSARNPNPNPTIVHTTLPTSSNTSIIDNESDSAVSTGRTFNLRKRKISDLESNNANVSANIANPVISTAIPIPVPIYILIPNKINENFVSTDVSNSLRKRKNSDLESYKRINNIKLTKITEEMMVDDDVNINPRPSNNINTIPIHAATNTTNKALKNVSNNPNPDSSPVDDNDNDVINEEGSKINSNKLTKIAEDAIGDNDVVDDNNLNPNSYFNANSNINDMNDEDGEIGNIKLTRITEESLGDDGYGDVVDDNVVMLRNEDGVKANDGDSNDVINNDDDNIKLTKVTEDTMDDGDVMNEVELINDGETKADLKLPSPLPNPPIPPPIDDVPPLIIPPYPNVNPNLLASVQGGIALRPRPRNSKNRKTDERNPNPNHNPNPNSILNLYPNANNDDKVIDVPSMVEANPNPNPNSNPNPNPNPNSNPNSNPNPNPNPIPNFVAVNTIDVKPIEKGADNTTSTLKFSHRQAMIDDKKRTEQAINDNMVVGNNKMGSKDNKKAEDDRNIMRICITTTGKKMSDAQLKLQKELQIQIEEREREKRGQEGTSNAIRKLNTLHSSDFDKSDDSSERDSPKKEGVLEEGEEEDRAKGSEEKREGEEGGTGGSSILGPIHSSDIGKLDESETFSTVSREVGGERGAINGNCSIIPIDSVGSRSNIRDGATKEQEPNKGASHSTSTSSSTRSGGSGSDSDSDSSSDSSTGSSSGGEGSGSDSSSHGNSILTISQNIQSIDSCPEPLEPTDPAGFEGVIPAIVTSISIKNSLTPGLVEDVPDTTSNSNFNDNLNPNISRLSSPDRHSSSTSSASSSSSPSPSSSSSSPSTPSTTSTLPLPFSQSISDTEIVLNSAPDEILPLPFVPDALTSPPPPDSPNSDSIDTVLQHSVTDDIIPPSLSGDVISPSLLSPPSPLSISGDSPLPPTVDIVPVLCNHSTSSSSSSPHKLSGNSPLPSILYGMLYTNSNPNSNPVLCDDMIPSILPDGVADDTVPPVLSRGATSRIRTKRVIEEAICDRSASEKALLKARMKARSLTQRMKTNPNSAPMKVCLPSSNTKVKAERTKANETKKETTNPNPIPNFNPKPNPNSNSNPDAIAKSTKKRPIDTAGERRSIDSIQVKKARTSNKPKPDKSTGAVVKKPLFAKISIGLSSTSVTEKGSPVVVQNKTKKN